MLLEQSEIDRERLQMILNRYGLYEKFRDFGQERYGR